MAPYVNLHAHDDTTLVTARMSTTEVPKEPHHLNTAAYIFLGVLVGFCFIVFPLTAAFSRMVRRRGKARAATSNTPPSPTRPPKPPRPTSESWERDLRNWRDMHLASQQGSSKYVTPPRPTRFAKRRAAIEDSQDNEVLVVTIDEDDDIRSEPRSPMIIGVSTAMAMPIKDVSGSQKSVELGSDKGREPEGQAPEYSAALNIQQKSDEDGAVFWDRLIRDDSKRTGREFK
ncbi:hypothetical protein F5Y11DRAFT_192797 [Daldinia sp. FL1419]|nr:hypothetical protein F5Y11DRAFT_192797 [Daldinia sp. FL1419]